MIELSVTRGVTETGEAAHPEVVLVAAASQLAGAATAAEVFEIALTAACDLAPWWGGPCVALFAGESEALELVAADGLCPEGSIGAVRAAEEWGEPLADAVRGGAAVYLPASPRRPPLGAGGRRSPGLSRLAQPLLVGGRVRGAILVTAAAPLTPGARTGLDALAFDVALALDRVDRAAALAHRGVELRALVLGSPDLVLLMDAEGEVRYMSPALEPILGRAPAHVVGTSVAELFARRPTPPAEREWVMSHLLAPQPEGPSRGVCRLRSAEGEWRLLN
jgi:PAS domain S-box-containing protein